MLYHRWSNLWAFTHFWLEPGLQAAISDMGGIQFVGANESTSWACRRSLWGEIFVPRSINGRDGDTKCGTLEPCDEPAGFGGRTVCFFLHHHTAWQCSWINLKVFHRGDYIILSPSCRWGKEGAKMLNDLARVRLHRAQWIWLMKN